MSSDAYPAETQCDLIICKIYKHVCGIGGQQSDSVQETDGPIVKATFDLLSETGLQSYWSRLDFACLNT